MGVPTTLGTCNVNLNFNSPSASGTTVVASSQVGLGLFQNASMFWQFTGATGDTLDIYLQISPDGGVTWYDWAHFAQVAAGASKITRALQLSKMTPILNTVQTVGTGLTPALAAGVFLGGEWTDRIRVVAVAGASTSAGAAQVLQIFMSGL